MSKPKEQRSDTIAPEDGGLEKAVRDYQEAGGSDAETDTTKELEGKIAKASATHDQQLKKGRPEISRTADR